MDPAILMSGIIILVFMILVTLGIFYVIQIRHIERITEIEHGIVGDHHAKNRYLFNLAIVCCSLGGGVIASYIMMSVFLIPSFIAISASLLICCGLGLFAVYKAAQNDKY